MLLNSNNINDAILNKAYSFFSVKTIQHGLAILNQGLVTVSFKKGSVDRYLIITGLCQDKGNQESKVVYKKRLEGVAGESPISSSCTCDEWNEIEHCPHSAALFLLSLLEESAVKSEQIGFEPPGDDKEHRPPAHLGVGVDRFGTIIKSPSKLLNSSPKATYTNLNYCLVNGKSTQMASPVNFEGKMVIEIFFNNENSLFTYQIKHRKKNGEINNYISIFERLYLFDWETGKSFFLPNAIKLCIEKLQKRNNFTTDVFLSYFCRAQFSDLLEIQVKGSSVSYENTNNVKPQMSITPSIDRNNYLNIYIAFLNDNGDQVFTPELLKLITFDSESGLLNGFKVKGDGLLFLEKMITCLENNSKINTNPLNNHPLKNLFENFLDVIQANDFLYFKAPNQNLYNFETNHLTAMLTHLFNTWGRALLKTIHYSFDGLCFQVNKNFFYDHIREFKLFFNNENNSPIFFKEFDISNWNQGITFQREQRSHNWFDLSLEFDDLDITIIQNANLERGISEINGKIFVLDDEQIRLAKFLKRYISSASIVKKDQSNKSRYIIPFSRARIFELMELKNLGVSGELTKEEEDIINTLSTLKAIPKAPKKEKEKKFLRPYQDSGVDWLHFLYRQKLGACLADDMGLGKTLQVISFISSIFRHDKKYLIICPVSILYNWKSEFEKFSELEVSIYHGPDRSEKNHKNIILTSYGILKKEYQSEFFQQQFEVIAMDEVQNLKNIRSIGSMAIRNLKGNFKICLTGTPVENDISEFFNILDLCVPGLWGDVLQARKNKFFKDKMIVRKSSKPFILRRTKDQVLSDLPDKIEHHQILDFDGEEKKFYNQLLATIQNEIRVTPKSNRFGIILRGILRLRQSCLWQPEDNQSIEELRDHGSTKIIFLCNQIEQILEEGHQALIFSQFTSYLDIIQKIFNRRNWKYSRIDGKYSVVQRQKEINKFQSGENKLFLISLKAGGVGLNLTAASYVFIMDPWWNPAVENQAVDRAHRIGQKNKVTVYRPIIKESVEEKILLLQKEKKQLFEDLLGQGEGDFFSGKLSKEDFEFILDTKID